MRTFTVDQWDALTLLVDHKVFQFVVAIQLRNAKAFYLTPNNEAIQFRGRSWQPFPMDLGDFADTGEGDLPERTLTLSNIGRLPMIHLEDSSKPWDQARVRTYLVLATDPTNDLDFSIDEYIQGATANHEAVTLNLSGPNWFDRPFPGKRYLREEGFPGLPKNQ